MKKFIFALALVLLFGVEVFAQDKFTFSFAPESKISDIQVYGKSFENSDAKAGAGLCYGPIWSAEYGKRWIADFVSVCGLGMVNTTDSNDKGQTDGVVGLEIVNLMGLQGVILFDPVKGEVGYGVGISITGLGKQLLK